ncbi:MAG: orotidine 5'-phosphate decarboxylase [Candidatus Bathyarchaeota archaeon]|nr:MAG: orotidine 5'-phosphate decarboxylase [Candidatus Bathyarchaeota archaeon]
MSRKYLEKADENAARLVFCLDIIEQTGDFCCAYKPNQQYVWGFTKNQHKTLTTAIHNTGALSILDYKLSDIGASIDSALFHIHECGYDAITFNPLLGNLQATVNTAHNCEPPLGVIALTLTSNPEALKYQTQATIMGRPLFIAIAEDVKGCAADGCVIGATGHVTEVDIRTIRARAGEDKLFLIPGIGTQKGDEEMVIKTAGRNVLINVGRAIIYSENPAEKTEEYNRLFNRLREAQS